MADTLSYGEDDGEDMVGSAQSNGSREEVTQEKDEISNAEADKEMVEDVVHLLPGEHEKAEDVASGASTASDESSHAP